jgi:hypothetical protein
VRRFNANSNIFLKLKNIAPSTFDKERSFFFFIIITFRELILYTLKGCNHLKQQHQWVQGSFLNGDYDICIRLYCRLQVAILYPSLDFTPIFKIMKLEF